MSILELNPCLHKLKIEDKCQFKNGHTPHFGHHGRLSSATILSVKFGIKIGRSRQKSIFLLNYRSNVLELPFGIHPLDGEKKRIPTGKAGKKSWLPSSSLNFSFMLIKKFAFIFPN